jgi:hypothetical protein
MELEHMFMRKLWVALALVAYAGAARADWQPEPPPVPPDTESAQRGRVAMPQTRVPPAADSSSAQAQLPSQLDSAATSGEVEQPQLSARAEPAAASGKLAAQPPAAASDGAAPQRVGPAAATHGTRADSDALRAFPPAPPPAVPGAAPEKPNTALTSFAPAPAPDQASSAPSVPSSNAPPASASAAGSASSASSASPGRAPTTDPHNTATAGPQSASPTGPAAASGDERPAHASEVWSAAALFGIAATFDNTVAGVNPLGFGFGVRGDYRVLPSWAIGARMLYFVGGSVELPSNEVAMQSWLLAAEAAYALELDPISIEPGIVMGLFVRETNYRGFGSFTDEPSVTVPDSTRLFFYFAPGVNVSVPLSVASAALDPLSLGADVRLDLAFGKHVTSNIQLLLQVGLRF